MVKIKKVSNNHIFIFDELLVQEGKYNEHKKVQINSN